MLIIPLSFILQEIIFPCDTVFDPQSLFSIESFHTYFHLCTPRISRPWCSITELCLEASVVCSGFFLCIYNDTSYVPFLGEFRKLSLKSFSEFYGQYEEHWLRNAARIFRNLVRTNQSFTFHSYFPVSNPNVASTKTYV